MGKLNHARMKKMEISQQKKIPRTLVFGLLYALFLLCFVFTPLWNTLPGVYLKFLCLLMICLIGIAWAWIGSSEMNLLSRSNVFMLILISSIALAVNIKSLTLPIPWRGDEDYHFLFAKWISSQMKLHLNYFLPFILFLIFISLPKIFLFYKNSRDFTLNYFSRINALYLILVFSCFTFSIAYISKNIHIDLYHVIRYPILIKYLTGLFVFLFHIFPFQLLTSHLGNEFPFRIIPLISSSIIAYLAFQSLPKSFFPLSILAAIFVLTIPLIRYYSSIFYLEIPAVLCIVLIAFSLQDFLQNTVEELKKSKAWYGLIFLGFIKETVLPFLFALVFCRIIYQFILFLKGKTNVKDFIQNELKFIFISCLPLFLYLFFRFRFGNTRAYSPHLNYLTDFNLLFLQLKSLWDSFGFLLVLIIPGSIIAWKKNQKEKILFFSFAILLEFLFHFLDNSDYTGYSRFNLFLFPSFFILGWELIIWISQKSPRWIGIIFCFAIGLNFSMSPINFDGTRKPFWGVYSSDIGEYDFPFREAFSLINNEYPEDKICLSGLNFPYFLDFYFSDKNKPEQIAFDSASIAELKSNPMKYLNSALDLSQIKKCDQLLYTYYTPDSSQYLKAISEKPFLNNPQSHFFKNQIYSLALFKLFPKLNHHVQSSKPSSNL